ncbi:MULTISPECIES: O-succinylhomoserine sulfhydrylase [Thioclava]|uniref:O-succinylhomoserine sulfhydrylase n=1 Tax=Thioclava TaxID=285107 RepID=UPI000B540CD6|nr:MULTISPECIES: O-succinylhomoserine sulfhydrylase [Thioclava]OWY05519.1 O-succinylhomoserine sulfhydrylase [Thioclava sp. F1Mire-8]OWY10807.1 O-succinylhomoserine sulfhydrylase [Thioclava sp. F42-5]OWY12789.1 O-succinylhomoserine sulfhydrylase [Thioclava sp. F34-6]PWE49864.1 O-succinylhomoserine sulfhydrylase [Thioclava sp. NG1]WGT50776.1 O-succinylhomoserine sulfhydrylase [Thioclava nitratireducens]
MTERKTRTKLVHDGIRRSQYGEMAEAMFLTQGFAYPSAEAAEARFLNASDDEFIYARYGNPTTRMFEDRMASIEGTEDAFACASGMAAINGALTCLVKAGDHIVAARQMFGSCLHVLKVLQGFGVDVTLVDGTDLDAWRAAMRPETKICFFESVSNPGLEVMDVAGIVKIAHEGGATVVVDNVFASPIFSRAVELGADVIVYSATKHIDGGGRVLGGVVLGSKEYIRGPLETYVKHTGGAMSPFHAWVLLSGLQTLDLRVRAQAANAAAVASAVAGHEKLARTVYPGLMDHPQHALAMEQMGSGGTMLALDLKGGKEAAFRFLNALQIVSISNNLGDAKSIATHPATTTHKNLSEEERAAIAITPGLIRVSMGIEDGGDLIADIKEALDAA